MLFHLALADKIKLKPHALSARLYLSRLWSLTFTAARCRARCRAPPAFGPGSAGADTAPPRWHRGPGKKRKRKERRGFSWPGRGVRAGGSRGRTGCPAERDERGSTRGLGQPVPGQAAGTDVVRAAVGRAPSCHRAQAPAGDITGIEKTQNLPTPTPLPPKGWLCWSDRVSPSPRPRSASPVSGRDQTWVFRISGEH